MSKSLKGLALSSVSLDGVAVHADAAPLLRETALAVALLASLANLSTVSLNQWRLRDDEALELGKCIRDKVSFFLSFFLSSFLFRSPIGQVPEGKTILRKYPSPLTDCVYNFAI